MIFIFSLFATIGSLIMSVYFSFPPCDLCWYQRMFMYPIAFVSGLALFKKDFKNGSFYSLWLAIVGGLIALYHYILQFTDLLKDGGVICSPFSSVDCSIPDFIEFGFVTTPLISLSIFVFAIICAIYASKRN